MRFPRGLGAGAGNTPLEVLVAVLDRMGADHGIDLYKIMDVAEDRVTPIMDHPIRIDRDSLTLGYAGVYSSFLLFAKRAEAKYGVSARDILVELGQRRNQGVVRLAVEHGRRARIARAGPAPLVVLLGVARVVGAHLVQAHIRFHVAMAGLPLVPGPQNLLKP